MKIVRPSHRGYSLLEVLLASAIFVLLAGGVYFSVSACVVATSVLGDEQVESRRLSAMGDFLRDGFLNLPPSSRFSLRSQTALAGTSLYLIIDQAADAFIIGGASGGSVALAARPDGRGASVLEVARLPERQAESERTEDLKHADWLPLLGEIGSLRWRFAEPDTGRLVETWEDPSSRPGLVELSLSRKGQVDTLLFRVPLTQKNEVTVIR